MKREEQELKTPEFAEHLPHCLLGGKSTSAEVECFARVAIGVFLQG